MANVGNVKDCSEVRIVDSELVDKVVDGKEVDNSYIKVDAKNVGNAYAHSVTINKGELVDDVVDTGSLTDSDILVSLSRVGNVHWSHFLNIYEGELVDEVVDVTIVRDTDISIVLRDVGNVHARSSIVIHGGELVDEIFDSKSVTRGTLKVDLHDVANVRCVPGAALVITHGQLLESVVDISGAVDSTEASVKIESSGYAHLSQWAISIVNGSIAKNAINVTGANSGIKLTEILGKHVACPVSA